MQLIGLPYAPPSHCSYFSNTSTLQLRNPGALPMIEGLLSQSQGHRSSRSHSTPLAIEANASSDVSAFDGTSNSDTNTSTPPPAAVSPEVSAAASLVAAQPPLQDLLSRLLRDAANPQTTAFSARSERTALAIERCA